MYAKAFLICFCLLLSSSVQYEERTIAWNASRKLSWADFKAQPDPNSDAVALTASGITFSYSLKTSERNVVDFSTTVKAHFYPEKSWYLTNKASAYILRHEQLHFDITELSTDWNRLNFQWQADGNLGKITHYNDISKDGMLVHGK